MGDAGPGIFRRCASFGQTGNLSSWLHVLQTILYGVSNGSRGVRHLLGSSGMIGTWSSEMLRGHEIHCNTDFRPSDSGETHLLDIESCPACHPRSHDFRHSVSETRVHWVHWCPLGPLVSTGSTGVDWVLHRWILHRQPLFLRPRACSASVVVMNCGR